MPVLEARKKRGSASVEDQERIGGDVIGIFTTPMKESHGREEDGHHSIILLLGEYKDRGLP